LTLTGEVEDRGLLQEVHELLISGSIPVPEIYSIKAVAVEHGAVIGVCVGSQADDLYVVVREEDRRRGVATSLLRRADEQGGGFVVAGSESGAALLSYFFDVHAPDNIAWEGRSCG